MVKTAQIVPLEQPVEPESERLKRAVEAYLKRLRFQDPALIAQLASECLDRASRHGRWDLEGVLWRALEEAQHRLDRALAQAMGVRLPEDAAAVSAVKAALLLTQEPVCADDLVRLPERPDWLAKLQARRPQATPPEAPGVMPAQDLEFWL